MDNGLISKYDSPKFGGEFKSFLSRNFNNRLDLKKEMFNQSNFSLKICISFDKGFKIVDNIIKAVWSKNGSVTTNIVDEIFHSGKLNILFNNQSIVKDTLTE